MITNEEIYENTVSDLSAQSSHLPAEANTPEMWGSILDLLLEMLSNCLNNATPEQVMEAAKSKTLAMRIASRKAVRAANLESDRRLSDRHQKQQADVLVNVLATRPDSVELATNELKKLSFNTFS